MRGGGCWEVPLGSTAVKKSRGKLACAGGDELQCRPRQQRWPRPGGCLRLEQPSSVARSRAQRAGSLYFHVRQRWTTRLPQKGLRTTRDGAAQDPHRVVAWPLEPVPGDPGLGSLAEANPQPGM